MPSAVENDLHNDRPDNHDRSNNEQTGQDNPEQKSPPDPAKRRRGLLIGAILLVVIAVGAFIWWSYTSTYESTDDAQVDGHLNPIASRVAGTIKAVYVEDNQSVEAGKPLVDLDPTDAEITLAQAQAQLEQSLAALAGERPNVPITLASNASDLAGARAEVATAAAAVGSAEHDYQSDVAQMEQSEANSAKAQADAERYKQLFDKHEVARSDFDQYTFTARAQAAAASSQKALVASALKTIEQKKAQLNEQEAKLKQTLTNGPRQILIKDANIQKQKGSLDASDAQVRQDQMNLSYCHIVAPVSGLISQRNAEVGARISVGQQLMLVIQTSDLWVTANFKETQLRKVRVGQRASIAVDGLNKTFEGYVESLPASTGDRTSALPPENATGNYVKVVQRLPLRIRFKPNQDGLERLRPGMSVEPKVFFP